MVRIQQVSRYLSILFTSLLIGFPLLLISQWIFMSLFPLEFMQLLTPEGYVNLASVPWNPSTKLLGFLAQSLQLAPVLLGLFLLKSIFKNYQKGEVFNQFNARRYHWIGWLFFLDALVTRPLGDLTLILAATLNNPPGHRYISIGFGTPNMEALLFGILVIVISWIMLEASKLNDEQKLTI